MGVVLVLLVVIFFLVGAFAVENGGGASMSFLGYHLPNVSLWVPTAIAVAAVSALLLVYMLLGGIKGGVRSVASQHRTREHEDAVNELRAENLRLREENAALRVRVESHAEPGSSEPEPKLS